MPRVKTLDELVEKRAKAEKEFQDSGGLPDYLNDYFGAEELRLRKTEFFVNKRRAYYEAYTTSARCDYKANEEKEFWEQNKGRIIKAPDARKKPEYAPPPRAEERLEDEHTLTPEEKRILIQMCETDLQLFAVRYFPHYLKKPSSKLHKFLYSTLSKEFNPRGKRREGFKWAIAAPRHGAKCLAHDTLIQLKTGALTFVRDLSPGTEIIGFDKLTRKQVYDKVLAVSHSGTKLVRDVVLTSGRKITITDEHRLFTTDCTEIRGKNIQVGTMIAVPARIDCAGKRRKHGVSPHKVSKLVEHGFVCQKLFEEDPEFLKQYLSAYLLRWGKVYSTTKTTTYYTITATDSLINSLYNVALRTGCQPLKQQHAYGYSSLLIDVNRVHDSDKVVVYDEVLTVSDYYTTDTYDIETAVHHNFIANNVYSHNSSIISAILPIWCIVYNKKRFILLISDTLNQAVDFLSDVKMELETNVALRNDFPYACDKGATWKLDEIITSNNIKIKALGTGNKVRGRRFGVHRPDLILLDDIENPEMVFSTVQRDFIRYTWFDKDVAYVGGEEGTVTDFMMVGTVLGKDSLLNALLDPTEYPDWKSKRFSAVERFSDSPLWDDWEKILKNRFDIDRLENAKKFFEDHRDEMLAGTSVLWPEGDPYYDLMIQKVTRPGSFINEKQNSPVDTTKIMITVDELHFEQITNNPKFKSIIKDRGTLYYGAIDPSLGKHSKKGDYSVIVTCAKDPVTGYVFVIDIDVRRRSVDDQIRAILRAHEKYHYHMFGVETNAFQYVVADNLRKLSRKEGLYVPIKEINQYKDKKMRFEGILPFLQDGTIIFDQLKYRKNPQYLMGVEQICTFTGDNDKYDDVPDCLEMAFSLCNAKKFKLTAKVNK